jgi:hypothetical protein
MMGNQKTRTASMGRAWPVVLTAVLVLTAIGAAGAATPGAQALPAAAKQKGWSTPEPQRALSGVLRPGRVVHAQTGPPTPAPRAQERLFFEICGYALRGRPEAVPILEGLVADWLEPLVAAEVAAGADPAAARNRARLGLATVRGLLLDLLATGDRTGVDAAMEEFLRLYYGSE